jgi:hypothetical protein
MSGYRMVSDASKAAFERWLDRCPDPQFLSPRRSAGAFDTKEDVPVFDPRFMNARVGDRIQVSDDLVIEVIADPDDHDEGPKPRIPAARLRRGNGNGYASP